MSPRPMGDSVQKKWVAYREIEFVKTALGFDRLKEAHDNNVDLQIYLGSIDHLFPTRESEFMQWHYRLKAD